MSEVVGSYSPSPANRTYAQLRAEILRYTGTPSDDNSKEIANDGIRDALRRINSQDWKFTIQSQDITLDSTNTQFDLNNDFKKSRVAVLIDSSGARAGRLTYYRPEQFLSLLNVNEVGGTGIYTPYTIINIRTNGVIEFYNTFDASFITSYPTVRLYYYGNINFPSDDSEVLTVPSSVESFIAWHAKGYVAANLAPEKMANAVAMAQQAYKDLIRDDRESGDY